MSALPSEAELLLIEALAEGVTLKQMASRHGVTSSAIAMRLSRLRAKVGAVTTTELVATAFRHGWIE